MRTEYQVSALYDAGMKEIVSDAEKWKDICRLTGRLYRYEFDNILMVYMQRPDATLVADYDTWKDKRVGRYVKRGSKGIAVFPSRALKPHIRHVFDISDTAGRDTKLTWELGEKERAAYAKYLGFKGEEKESAEIYLKDFTEKRIGVIIELEFDTRVSELMQQAGTKRKMEDGKTQEITAGEALKRSVMYAVFTRCGFDLPPEKQDFTFITDFSQEEDAYRLGSLVSDISCEVLKSIARELTQMERGIAYGRNNDLLQSGGRNVISESHVAGGENLDSESRKIRSEGSGISEGEPQREIHGTGTVRETGGEDAGSGRRSVPDDGYSGERLSETESASKSTVHNGDLETKRTGENAGRGAGNGGSGAEIPLEETGQKIIAAENETDSNERKEQLQKELERELSELNNSGMTETGSFEQASFSFTQNGEVKIPTKYTYVKPKMELVVPHEYVREVLLKGSGFSHGKKRIYEIFDTVSDTDERVKRIKKEYGEGGAGWPINGHGLHGYDTYHGKGIRFQWRDEEGEKDGYISWKAVERELSVLIMTGEYYQPPKMFDELEVSPKLWQKPLDDFFNNGFWLDTVNIALKEVLSRRKLPESSRVQFVERAYHTGMTGFGTRSMFQNDFGNCEVERHEWGISIEFYDENNTKWRHELDWEDCTKYLSDMMKEGIYHARGSYDEFAETAEKESRASGIKTFKEYTERFLSETAYDHQWHRVEIVKRILEAVGRADLKVSWSRECDVLFLEDKGHLYGGRQAYDYIKENCLRTDKYGRDERIHWEDMEQFRHDAFASIDLMKKAYVIRQNNEVTEETRNEIEEKEAEIAKNPLKREAKQDTTLAEDRTEVVLKEDVTALVNKSEKKAAKPENLIKQEEEIWQDALRKYFNEEIQYISVKTLLYDIFTTNLTLQTKAEFLAEVYGVERENFSIFDKVSGAYGDSLIVRDEEGIGVSYIKPDGTSGEYKADYLYCASLILHMIEKNDYLSEEVFEKFQKNKSAFMAMPWFMELYQSYKERMEKDVDFSMAEGKEGEIEKQTESELLGEQKADSNEKIATLEQRKKEQSAVEEAVEKVEGEVLDQRGRVIKPVSNASFPNALEQVEEMEEDLREAVELYLTGCSTIRPYQPLLQMVHESRLSKSEKLSFLNRTINHVSGDELLSAYHNNAYGLVEYLGNKQSFIVNYKNKQEERKKVSITYEQIYSVMEYLIRAGQFTEKARMELYRKEFMTKPYEKLAALEKQFRDKLENLEVKREKENFHFEDFKLPKAGQKTRYQWNVEAIRLMKQIEREERAATLEEQKILARYVGWGDIPQAFDEKNESWKKEYEELKSLLTDSEYADARESVTTAFYTSLEIIEAVYQGLSQLGFKQGTVLEPSMGIGHFFGAMPESMIKSRLYGVEKDSISGRIAKLLYPKANIKISGFEDIMFPDNFFDVAVGNIPFGDFKLYDKRYAKHNFRIHDYFFGKALDKVRPGGIVAFVTSKGTMDKANSSVRKYLAERAELIGAVRLPNTAFRDSAGTDVTSDILFLQKREQKTVVEPDWVHLGKTEDGIPVNSYFVEHPEMMLGKMEYDTRMFGNESKYTSCVNHEENFDLKTALSQAVSNLQGQITDVMELADAEEQTKDMIEANPDVKNYTFTFVDGKLYYRENSVMYRREVSTSAEEKIRLMDEIRTITRQLIFIQSEGCSEAELKFQQKLLNEKYDAYVKKFGPLTGRGSKQAFRDDVDYPLLCSLEVIDEDGNVKKTDMFYKQTIRAKIEVDRVETALEALHVSVNEFGEVNIPYMLGIYEPDLTQAMKELPEGSTLSENAEAELKRAVLLKELEGLVFLDPQAYDRDNLNMGWKTADEYLSGNVREKLRVAKAKAKENGELFAINVQALEQVQPKDLDASEIEVRIGTTWIDTEDYEQFLFELLGTPHYARAYRSDYSNSGIQIKYNTFGQNWYIENKRMDYKSVAATKTYGTGRIDAYSIMEESLNLRTVTVRDRIDDGDGKYHYEVNKKETMLAREKQNQIKEAFRSWIFKEQERRQKYVEYYNNTFNCIRLRSYDGSFLKFSGMNPEIQLREHQKNAVARILLGGNTLLAHVVGGGKTYTMMAACMELKRLGLANKTAIIVPKAIIGQTAGEFMRLYPSANILVATERDFEKSRRKQFISRIATGDYDCIVMSHSQFEKIPISKERKEQMLDAQINEISRAIEEIKAEKGEQWTIKQMEGQKKRLEEQMKALSDESRKDDLICFEELGIDSIMVDEAHHYKNCAIFSKINNVSGISSSGSQKAMDMLLKCQYLTELNSGRGIVFATGTPVSNTMCELYVMQNYLQKATLERMGMGYFDAWAANFGEVTTALELTVEGKGFRFKSRFNKFTNVPELMTTFREIADVQTADMLSLPVPKLRTGNYIIVDSEPDWYVEQVMESFVKRAENIRNGGVDPSVDNFLKITHEARLLGTDARLLETDAPNNPDSKLNKVIENVAAEYFQNNTDGKIGCQLIFSDIGVPKSAWSEDWEEQFESGNRTFDIYNYVKTGLVKVGIPAEEIAFIHDAKSDAQRDILFKEVRTGKKKILIGSTDQCGTGVNVQKHLVAMHHIDCPWKPSCIEQREGRGIRQGNENEEIAVYRYVTKGTFDAYSWSLIENKQRFISQIMTSRAVYRTCEDIDEATLSYAEIKAVATGNPLIREKMELENDVQRLKVLKSSYDSQRYNLEDNIMVLFPKLIAAAKEKAECVRADIKRAEAEILANPEFEIEMDKTNFTERVDGGTYMLKLVSISNKGKTTHLGKFKGFELLVEKNFIGTHYMVLRGKTDHKAELSTSPVGNMVKLENLLGNMAGELERVEQKLKEYERNLEQSKIDFEKTFQQEAELAEKIARLNELNNLLDLENGKTENIDIAGQEEEPDIETEEKRYQTGTPQRNRR